MTAPAPVDTWLRIVPEFDTSDLEVLGIAWANASGIPTVRAGRPVAPPQKLSVLPTRVSQAGVVLLTIAAAALLTAAPAKIRFNPEPTTLPSTTARIYPMDRLD